MILNQLVSTKQLKHYESILNNLMGCYKFTLTPNIKLLPGAEIPDENWR